MTISVVTPLWQDQPAEDNLQVAKIADQLGYERLWIGEMATYDAFAFATAVAARTNQINFAIGPLAVSVRSPMTIAMGIASVAALSGRNTRLALGTSSHVVVEYWHGRSRARPARQLAEAATIVRGLLEGEKVDFSGEVISSRGYRLRLPAPGADIAIAAFGPQAVKVAAAQGDCMLLNLVTPASVAKLKQQLHDAAKQLDRPAPKVAAWVTTAVDPTTESVNQMLQAMVGYLAAPGYDAMFIEAGFGDLVELARSRPHPKEILAAMTPELAAAVGMVGSTQTVEQRIAAYRDAGVDELCIVPATAGDPGGERTLQALRPAPAPAV
jgi:probable F420-dependent oxidoreductase